MEETMRALMLFAPLLGQLTHQERIVQLATELTRIGMEEADRLASQKGQTRERVLADAAATWDEVIKGADELAGLGHDGNVQ